MSDPASRLSSRGAFETTDSAELDVLIPIHDGDAKPVEKPLAPAEKPIILYGINISQFGRYGSFTILSLALFFFFMASGYVEEYLFKSLPNFQFGWFLTLFELLCFAGIAVLERVLKGENPFQRRAELKRHGTVAVAMCASRGLTNMSLQFLNYPTQVIFKSMKLITVMIGNTLMARTVYDFSQYVSAMLLIASAILFSLADVSVTPNYDPIGIIVVVVSLVFDSLHTNTQEVLKKQYHADDLEVMFFTNIFSAIGAFLVCLFSGELLTAIFFCNAYPVAYALMLVRAMLSYGGVRMFLAMVGAFGAVATTAVTTVRKVLTVLVSFLMFPKPFHQNYLWGVAFFMATILVEIYKDKVAQRKAAGR